MRLGEEFRSYQARLKQAINNIYQQTGALVYVPVGGTAIGTGLNAPEGFREETGLPLKIVADSSFGIASHDALLTFHQSIQHATDVLFQISNDLRMMASGPRAGLAEIILPANEPGSSIMPGKVNPTQIESLQMVCLEIRGNHLTCSEANMNGQFQLNTFKPLLADASISFQKNCITGIKANSPRLKELMGSSLMIGTALTPHVGYDKATKIAQLAQESGISIKEAALKSGYTDSSGLDEILSPKKMI